MPIETIDNPPYYKIIAAAEVVKTKAYKARVTQTGTNAPVATVFENTLGTTGVWTRVGVGSYELNLGQSVGGFAKMWLTLIINVGDLQVSGRIDRFTDTKYALQTFYSGINADGMLDNHGYVELIMYP